MGKKTPEISDYEFELEEEENFVMKIKMKKKKNHMEDNDEEEKSLPNLPEAIIYDILAKIPSTYLQYKFRYICKSWHKLISSSKFIAQNFVQSKHELLLIQTPTSGRKRYYKTKSMEMDENKLDFELSDFGLSGMGEIRCSCNGLLLITDSKQRGVLHVMNFVTKCVISLPKCPSGCPHRHCASALGFDPSKKEYKVVHIYSDGFGYEIFTLGCSDNEWKQIPGPFKEPYEWPFDLDSFCWREPASINGEILHWHVNSSKYIISTEVSDERTSKTYLPDCGEVIDIFKYKLLEMGGYLSFVYTLSKSQFEIWILKDFHGQVWFKKHSIITKLINYTNLKDSSLPNKYDAALPDFEKLVPLASLRNGEVILLVPRMSSTSAMDHRMYLYETKHRELRKFKMKVKYEQSFVPHKNSLICWKTGKELLPRQTI